MEINNYFDFAIYASFTLVVLVAGLPMGVICLFGGLRLFTKYKWKDIPRNSIGRTYGKKPIEILLSGIFITISSTWYLFFDNGGHLFLLWSQIRIINWMN